MKDRYDVVIVGGAVMGSSTAYFLKVNPDFRGSVLIVEKDPTFRMASTALSSSSIRHQFSNPINVKLSQFSTQFFRDIGETLRVGDDSPDLGFREGGYLFLANTAEGVATMRQNHEVHQSCGADVVLWGQDELRAAFPHIRSDDILLASYGRSGEGWFSNTGLMNALRSKARALGADYVIDEVVSIGRQGARVTNVGLKSGRTIEAGIVVNASGPRADVTARMAGLNVPVEPRKRTIFVFDCEKSPEGSANVNNGRLPMMNDPTGVFCRPEGRFFLCGCVPVEDPVVDWEDFEPRYNEFEDIIWPILADRVPAFEAIKVVNQWAGHYEYNRLDANLIVGFHPEVRNFIFINGFSGHGLQQSPGAGRAVSELITYGEYRTLDLSEAGYERVLEGRRFEENAVL